jgi:mono/diheme cytochrome c family protein
MRTGRLLGYFGAAALVVVVLGAAFVYSGIYDVSATDQHQWPTYWTLRAAMERSVGVRARRLQVPPLDEARARRGVGLYREHCLRCHGAPGVAPEPFALGMLPVPENLAYVARTWSTAEIYWTVRNGLKMTGMAAWQYRLSDDEMWDIVAFVKELPQLAPAQYAALKASPPLAAEKDDARAADAERGRQAIRQYACVTCHEIPGFVGSNSPVGPPLEHIAKRSFIAGVLPNNAENMTRWVRAPQEVKPGTAMPDLHVRVRDAKDIAAFLETLH